MVMIYSMLDLFCNINPKLAHNLPFFSYHVFSFSFFTTLDSNVILCSEVILLVYGFLIAWLTDLDYYSEDLLIFYALYSWFINFVHINFVLIIVVIVWLMIHYSFLLTYRVVDPRFCSYRV